MKKIELYKSDLVFIGILCLLASVFTTIWLALTGNAPQVYNDIVVETTALVRSNKGAEMLLLKLLIIAGSLAVFCRFKFFHDKTGSFSDGDRNVTEAFCLVAFVCSFLVLNFIFFQKTSSVFVYAVFFAVAAFLIEKEVVISTLCLYFISYYAFFALYHACIFLGGYEIVSVLSKVRRFEWPMPFIFAFFCTLLPLFFKKRKILIKKLILLLQLVMPALFLILTIKQYDFHGVKYEIGIPLSAGILIACAVAVSFFYAVRTMKKSWKSDDFDVSSFISICTCIAIGCFNTYSGTGAVVLNDPHHPFENVFAFQQIFELGQLPFRDFIPPSGMYSVLVGAFFKLFGNGNIAYYNLTDNIFCYVIFAAIIILLQFYLKKIWCFALAVFLHLPLYNRTLFMPVVVLLLLLPQLVKRENLWLKVFLLVSLFHGLYYPLYGVACFVGFIPMFIVQIRKVVSDGSKPYRNAKFWIGWLTVFAVLLFSLPLLLGMMLHIKAMSNQSVLADGISIFGQPVPDYFMPYVNHKTVYFFYNILHVFPIAMIVWLTVLFLLKGIGLEEKTETSDVNFINRMKIKCIKGIENSGNIDFLTMALSLIFIPLISYTYGFIRMDMWQFFARSYYALISFFILYFVFFAKYVKRNSVFVCFLLIPTVFIVLEDDAGIAYSRKNLISKIDVPAEYVILKDFKHDTVGTCFVSTKIADSLFEEESNVAELAGESSFAKMPWFGYYFMFKQKGGANVESQTVRGFGAAKETRNMIVRQKILVGSCLKPLEMYYIYNWLVSSGEYVWDSSRNAFVPNENISNFTEIKKLNSECPLFLEEYDLVNTADVFGLSYKTLKKIFSEQKTAFDVKTKVDEKKLEIEFSEPVHGKDADFMYLDFQKIKNEYKTTIFTTSGEYFYKRPKIIANLFLKKKPNPDMKVFVCFYDENGEKHEVHANYGNGKLLLNLGVGSKYLLEKHSVIEVAVEKNGIAVDLPPVKDVKFLKCRQIFEDKFDYNSEY